MFQLYLFIAALTITLIIVGRRNRVFNRDRKKKFKEDVAQKVDELQKERQEMQQERFKEVYLKERHRKKYDFAQYKLIIRKADMAMAKKQWHDAKKFLIQSMAMNQDELHISLKLAKVYLESGDLKRAQELYERLLEIENKNPAIFENLAKIFIKKKKYKEAIRTYVQAIELDDKDDKKLVGLGRLYQLLMRPSLAAGCFRRAAELKPREIEYLFMLADACRKAEDHENALFTYEKILTIEPYNERAQSRAQDVRIKLNEIEKVTT